MQIGRITRAKVQIDLPAALTDVDFGRRAGVDRLRPAVSQKRTMIQKVQQYHRRIFKVVLVIIVVGHGPYTHDP